LGILKSNCQTFEEKFLIQWVDCFKEIVSILIILHVLKYPTSLIQYDYSKKFGIDVPSFSHFREHELDLFRKLIKKDEYNFISELCLNQQEVIEFNNFLESMPTMTEDQVDVESHIILTGNSRLF